MGEKENLKQKNNGEEKPVFQTIKQLSTFIDKNLKDLSNQFQLAENKLPRQHCIKKMRQKK